MSTVSMIPNMTIYIGNKHDTTNIHSMNASYKLYGCKIFNASELIRNYVPANKNGKAGMIETISNRFYEFKEMIYDK